MSACFHTPTAPLGSRASPRATNRAGIYFLCKHHPGGRFSWMEKSGESRSGEGEAGQGGMGRGEERAELSALQG